MPGITGIIRKSPYEGVETDLRLMVQTMRHVKHASSGEYVNADFGLCAGWVSHEGSFSDCMPLIAHDKNIVLIFQGEHYPTTDSSSRFERLSKDDNEASARYLLDLYTNLGSEFFRHLNGWFCGIVVDVRARTCTLFNDRYGMGRIYIHEGKDEFLFASEAKAILKIRPALRNIEPGALAERLRYNCVTGNKTLFKGISLLPHGSAWEFQNGVLSRRRQYFDFGEWERQPSLKPQEFYQKFSDTLSRVVPIYTRSAKTVAFSLTAGLDTRAITAALQERNRTLPCYTFGGSWGELFDVRTARKVAKVYDQPYDVIRVGSRFLNGFPGFAGSTIYISDGTHDAFGAHDVYLNEIARGIAPIRLTGKFGSEVVRIRRLLPSLAYPQGLLQPDLKSLVDGLPSYAQMNPNGHPLTRVVSEEIPWHEYGRVAVEQSQLTLRTPYMDNDLVKLMYQVPTEVRAAGKLQEEYIRDKSRELATIATNMGKLVSKNQMVTRFLYGALWALFKVEYIYLYATPHWLTRFDRSLGSLRLERLLAGRQKWEGYRIWIKTEFPDFIRQTLLNPRAQYTRYFERKAVEKMAIRHTAGTHNYFNEINSALTVELICSTLLNS